MIAMLLLVSLALNIWYLVTFRILMKQLETGATSYWHRIGRPNSFAGVHVSAVLSNLYRREMSNASVTAGAQGLLRNVRVLLPVAFVVTGFTLYYLAVFLEKPVS